MNLQGGRGYKRLVYDNISKPFVKDSDPLGEHQSPAFRPMGSHGVGHDQKRILAAAARLSFQLINVLTFMKPKDNRGMYSSLIIQRKSLRHREAMIGRGHR